MPSKPEARLVYSELEKSENLPALEAAQRQTLQQVIQAGYNPAEDILAFAKLEEIQAFDKFARWQVKNGVPLIIEPILVEADREHLAAIGALGERRRYHATRTAAKAKATRWVHEGWELDSDSEAELLRQVYDRIKDELRVPRKAG